MKRNFFSRHKKAVVIVVILLIAAIAAVLFFKHKKQQEAMKMMEDTGPETRQVERQTISNYVSMTGNVTANDSQTVYTTINELEVLAVNVKVGDTVHKGDVLARLDSSDFEDKLADARKDLERQKDKTALQVAQAEKKYNQVLQDVADSANDTNQDIEYSSRDYGYNVGDKDDAYKDWQDALEDYEDAKKDYNEAHKKYKKLKKNKDSVKYEGVTYYYDDTATSTSSTAKFSEDEGSRRDLKKIVDQLEDAMDSAEKAATNAQRAYTNAVEGLEKQHREYDKSVQTEEDKIKENARKIEDAAEELYSTKLEAEGATEQLESQIKDYQKNIEKCTIKAPISGVVTSVKMEVGDETDGDNNVICVINDTSSYKVEGTVDEYDIAKLGEGMSAVIKTESTGDLEMTGKVTFVSPTPETGNNNSSAAAASSGSSEVNYPVKVLLDKLDQDVRIGMTAEVNILTQTAENVLTVPYECITQNIDGDYVIYAVKAGKVSVAPGDEDKTKSSSANDKNKRGRGGPMGGPPGGFGSGDSGDEISISQIRELGREIVVEKILETDYYTAITGDGITEGMEVYVVTTASEESDEPEDDFYVGF